uniref:uncharacterized protein LOC124062338 isoform X2 n=1 Tax=Scatophagus argus TaxID=75038 RepID=UPI001ED85C77|nr:uncharacterized protein LOC124062338 isoform X2 [Scatophagus argus]
MSPANYLRLFVFCLWLLGGDVNCESTQKGYVLHVQAGHVPMGVYNDDRDYKTWRELPIFRAPAAGSQTSDVGRGQSGSIYPEPAPTLDHTTNPKPRILSSYPVSSESQYSNVPKNRINHFKSGLSSHTQGWSTVAYNLFGNKAFAFPDGKKIHRAKSDSVFSTGVVKVPPSIYRARTKLTGGFSSVPEDQATVGFGQVPIHTHSSTASPDIHHIKSSLKSKSYKTYANPSRPNIHPLHQQESHRRTRPKVSGSHPAHVFPYNFDHVRVNPLQKVVKLKVKETDSIIKGHSPASNSAGKMSYPTWSPRIYGSDVMPKPRGYAHVHHLKPGSDKIRCQVTSAAGDNNQAGGILHHKTEHKLLSKVNSNLFKGFPLVMTSMLTATHQTVKLLPQLFPPV